MGGYADKLLSAPTKQDEYSGNWWDRLTGEGTQTIGPAREIPRYVGEDPSKMPSVGTLAASSLPTDELTRVKYLASKRFPGVPSDEALNNYFYKNDRLAFTGPNGANYEDPAFRAPISLPNLLESAKALFSSAGPAMAPIASTVATLPLLENPAIAIPVGAGAGGIADQARQFLARKFTGEEKSIPDSISQSTGAAVQEGVGQALGAVGGKLLGGLGRTPTYNLPETTDLMRQSRVLDIPLTPGEATGNRALLRRQKILANTTDADETFETFYKGRNEKVGAAVNDILTMLSGKSSVREAAGSGVSGAQAVARGARSDMQKEAGPIYDVALKPGNVVALRTIQDTLEPHQQAILQHVTGSIRKDPILGAKLQGWQDNSMFALDQVKKQTDSMINAAKREGDNHRVSILTDFKDKMVGAMDASHPEYARARAIYEEGMPAASNLEKGIVGDAAKLENNDVLRASKVIFGTPGSSAPDVAIARDAFEKAGKEQEWNDLVRSHIQSTLEAIPDSANGSVVNLGGTFRKNLYGTEAKRKIMDEALALNPGARQSVNWLMNVLEASGRATKGESITAFAQQGQKELAREGAGLGPRALETLEVWRTPSRLSQFWADVNAGKYAAKQAEIMTSPDGLQKLAELRTLSPTSARALVLTSHLLLAGGLENAGPDRADAYVVPKDRKQSQSEDRL